MPSTYATCRSAQEQPDGALPAAAARTAGGAVHGRPRLLQNHPKSTRCAGSNRENGIIQGVKRSISDHYCGGTPKFINQDFISLTSPVVVDPKQPHDHDGD